MCLYSSVGESHVLPIQVSFTAYFGGAIVCSNPPRVSGGCEVCLCVRVCINAGSTGLVVDACLGVYVATWKRTV